MPATPASRSAATARTPRRRRVDVARRELLVQQIEDIFLSEGFMSVTMAELTERLHCSKATLYSVATTKEQLVVLATKKFFGSSAEAIEIAVAAQDDPREQITTYLGGVADAMRRNSRAFYADMIGFEPTAEIYRRNTEKAAERVRELIDGGIADGVFSARDGVFASQLVALAIEGVQSGVLLDRTGLSAADAFAELGHLLLNGLLR
ncbi:TetR/AcrR family transcriptional regulator [Rhodococcus sp. 06-462-5]|uniref:TetR/AcrR family transcriptional regulator n=1 Tax=Nocardiaceae TaxID=85025 RepID=UPI00050C2759|nr:MULTISPECIES: TetR/AcrR family transcriptional regulator [Rhodococcus]OZC74024.1 TetR/AcrR family transcriptional regulator [Rhodococcus sp. 06-462-5]OZE68020.1 TetR/AcrR family transcriptional regulator [Rhodococcus sp. 02-925g]OZF51958.1 TetR/AcrR family transcriptional regulator [Rhodococcus sp. 14-1411-2a]